MSRGYSWWRVRGQVRVEVDELFDRYIQNRVIVCDHTGVDCRGSGDGSCGDGSGGVVSHVVDWNNSGTFGSL